MKEGQLMRRAFCIIAAALTMVFAVNASAQSGPIPDSGVTYEDIASWLKSKGHDATITKDGLDHKIVSTTIDGVKFGVYFFDCQNDKCGSVQFAAGFPKGRITVDRVMEWNRTKRWARVYFDKSDGIWIEMDMDLTPGGTYELLGDELATWRSLLKTFKEFFNMS
jgi:hypothetical protein